jgi:hypothetical protein
MFAAPTILALITLFQSGVGPQAEVRGPATICFAYSSFTLNAGEYVESEQISAHGVRLRIQGPSGFYDIQENDVIRPSRPLGTKVYQVGNTSVFRSRHRPFRYAFVAPTAYSPTEPRMIASISGEALTGARNDASFYRRLTIADPSRTRCDHTYRSGLDALRDGVR